MGNNLTKTPNFGSIKCFFSLNVGKYLVINQQRHFINVLVVAYGRIDGQQSRQMHFINVLVVAYGRIDGQQSNKNSQLWFYKMLLFFECWKIPSNQPAKAFYKYQSRCYRARGLGPQNGEVQGENNKGEQLNGRTKMGKWYKMRNVTLMVSKHEKYWNCKIMYVFSTVRYFKESNIYP